MAYSDVFGFDKCLHREQWEGADGLKKLSEDYSRAKMAEKELVQMKKVVWLLLKQIGEPVIIDKVTLLQVPEDFQINEEFDPAMHDFITMTAK